jgi:hypothetical protein
LHPNSRYDFSKFGEHRDGSFHFETMHYVPSLKVVSVKANAK